MCVIPYLIINITIETFYISILYIFAFEFIYYYIINEKNYIKM